jgi:hypothetical protein
MRGTAILLRGHRKEKRTVNTKLKKPVFRLGKVPESNNAAELQCVKEKERHEQQKQTYKK